MATGSIALLGLLWAAPPALCQQPEFDREKMVQAQKENAAALMRYTWKSRTELKQRGASKSIKLDQVSYDASGQIQKTPLASTRAPSEPQKQPERHIVGPVTEKIGGRKKDEFAGLMQEIVQLVMSYAHLPPDKLAAFMQSATVQPGAGSLDGTVSVHGKNLLQTGDALTIWIDPSTLMMRHIEISTLLDKKPVSVIADYASVQAGPTYMARAAVAYPEKWVNLTIDNYEYERSSS